MADLFKFFNEMNKGNFDYVDSLEDKEIKELAPFMLSMWLNGAKSNNGIHTILTDYYCNPYIFPLGNHPKLLLKLFIAANEGIDKSKYQFKKYMGQEETKILRLIADYYSVNVETAKDYKKLLSDEDLKKLKEMDGE